MNGCMGKKMEVDLKPQVLFIVSEKSNGWMKIKYECAPCVFVSYLWAKSVGEAERKTQTS